MVPSDRETKLAWLLQARPSWAADLARIVTVRFAGKPESRISSRSSINAGWGLAEKAGCGACWPKARASDIEMSANPATKNLIRLSLQRGSRGLCEDVRMSRLDSLLLTAVRLNFSSVR